MSPSVVLSQSEGEDQGLSRDMLGNEEMLQLAPKGSPGLDLGMTPSLPRCAMLESPYNSQDLLRDCYHNDYGTVVLISASFSLSRFQSPVRQSQSEPGLG
jgi:hypothetical protein